MTETLAAVPKYAQDLISHQGPIKMPPGHRFGPFLKAWTLPDWKKGGKSKTGKKEEGLDGVTTYPAFKKLADALRQRQRACARDSGVLSYRATNISPFVTGTGMEHPLENGFAFLAPYGLPYLPGAGVKGVVRRTAEQLAAGEFGETKGWSQAIIDQLFGPESDTDARRGALEFWDVLIDIPNCALEVDILTPHFDDYYQKKGTPHTTNSPVPVPFLVVPPASGFEFHIGCSPQYLTDTSLTGSWKTLVRDALEAAIDWMGFGAKTRVGYGQFTPADIVRREENKRHEKRLLEAGIKTETYLWEKAEARYEPANGRLTLIRAGEQVQDPNGKAVWESLDISVREKYKKRRKKKKPFYVRAELETQGNMWKVLSLEPVSDD